jgi:hypothetical protein
VRGEDLIHLLRIDTRRSGGWQVRLPDWHPSVPKTAYFADSRHGGKQGAYVAARAHRDMAFDKADLPLHKPGHAVHPGKSPGSATSLPGVRLARLVTSAGKAYYYWMAVWREGPERRVKFSVIKLGYEAAFWEAVHLRETKTGITLPEKQLRAALKQPRPEDLEEPRAARRPSKPSPSKPNAKAVRGAAQARP